MSYAVQESYRTDNPVNGVVRPADEKRQFRLDEHGFRILGERIQVAENDGETWQAIAAIRFMAFTGCRRGEVERLKRSEVDLAGRVLRPGDSETGRSVRPLGCAAIEVLKEALARSRGPFVFPGVRQPEKPFGALPRAWERIIGDSLPTITPHGLRHSFASVADDLGFTEATIGAMLGHSGSGTTRGYIHKLDPALLAAADGVSRHIANAMAGTTTTVVRLPDRARA